ncbi:MAG: hypothetical protein ACFFG0_52425, partial [Candidatus Thorarchaeota archaeon]
IMNNMKKVIISVVVILSCSSLNLISNRIDQHNIAMTISEEKDLPIDFWESPKLFLKSISDKQKINKINNCIILATKYRDVGFKALFCGKWNFKYVYIKILKQSEFAREARFVDSFITKISIKNDKNTLKGACGFIVNLKNGKVLYQDKKECNCYILPDRFTDFYNPGDKKIIKYSTEECFPPTALFRWLEYVLRIIKRHNIKLNGDINIREDNRLEKFFRDFEKSTIDFDVDLRRL